MNEINAIILERRMGKKSVYIIIFLFLYAGTDKRGPQISLLLLKKEKKTQLIILNDWISSQHSPLISVHVPKGLNS